jgi:hypothetical protein
MLYLTVYFDAAGRVCAHTGAGPLAFVREAPAERGRVLYRAVIDGELIEDDAA